MSARVQFKTEPRLLSHVKNLLEGYDNLTVMTVVNAQEGLFELIFPEGPEREVVSIMEEIKKEIRDLENIKAA